MHLLVDLFLVLFFTGVLLSPAVTGYLCVNPALPANYIDAPAGNSLSFGIQDTTIPTGPGNTSPVAFTTEKLDITFSFKVDVTNNSSARPQRQKGLPEVPEAELGLTANGNGAPLPYLGAEFSLQDTMTGVSYTFWTTRIVHSMTNDGNNSKCTVAVRWKLN
jgi:hypothetical protein